MALKTAPGNDHLAEFCHDDLCTRLPCRLYKQGKADGYDIGYLDGEAAGFSAGFAAGLAAGSTS